MQEEKSKLTSFSEKVGSGLAIVDYRTPRLVKIGAAAAVGAVFDVAVGAVVPKFVKQRTLSAIAYRTIKNMV